MINYNIMSLMAAGELCCSLHSLIAGRVTLGGAADADNHVLVGPFSAISTWERKKDELIF